jgi:ribonuclease HII
MAKRFPTLDLEQKLLHAGYPHIAGLDEAGRGAWAGPVAAGAVILPLGNPSLLKKLEGVCDSKLCTPRQRDILYDAICEVALAWAVSLVPAARIDKIGIAPATRQAMHEAIARLDPAPDALLIDFIKLPAIQLEQLSIKKGDQKSLTIAAASILAKVTRDRQMIALDEIYAGYGFARHKGYGTRQHQTALRKLGIARIHRRSFAPIAASIHTSDVDIVG